MSDLLLLRTRHPYLVAQALAHILRGSLDRAVIAGIARGVVAQRAVDGRVTSAASPRSAACSNISAVRCRSMSRSGAYAKSGEKDVASNVSTNVFAAVLRLNFLRVAVAVAALVGFAGCGHCR